MPTKPPVPLDAVAHFGTGVTARITRIKALYVHAVGPGGISGPGLNIAVEISNHTAKPINLTNAVVTITDASGTPGTLLLYGPQASHADSDVPETNNSYNYSHPMTGSLAAQEKASGSYVFTLPTGHRDPITINFSYAGGGPVVLFKGVAA